MCAMEQSRFTLRIHPLIMAKMKYIAETNGRSVNKEIEQILKWVISDFENKRGRIHIDEEDQPGFRGTRTNKEQLRRLEEQAQMRSRPISSALFKINK
ncbi:MAG: Arc family DNA-binding protein [Acidaminococcaceae bacterium]|uniref:Arc family DNA-binding protein n=1 Tax=Succiniclasticum sp. TaxID=2775030 RepID=UPI001AFD9F2E|nr:Arc family DNA-binding protein [Succiniclasticum sp.]MBO5590774.1 Arc family DNA-binding protein [Acidaminococcaceae bacterium]MBO5637015.1 Arc family DNA-binding protein [Acidaminococcaceae bacterium]MBP3811511.1 Arc family DNA-binding protein [Acidaminococcaceae bacterium]MBR1495172.1 Arc family DNA-binding protein [Acidaminococcaceae bacterium]MBR1661286.1 Arc family DNA-binding protein [Acidaminococcaceae bacterium]